MPSTTFGRASRSTPHNHQAWLNLAVILGEMRHADEAIDACRRCMALQPASSEAFAVLGNLLRIAQNNVDAAAAYSDSLRLKPAQPDILTRLGELMLQSGDAAEALVHCRRALEINPSHEAAGTLERRILASTGSLDTAQALLEAQAKTPAELAQSLRPIGRLFTRRAAPRGGGQRLSQERSFSNRTVPIGSLTWRSRLRVQGKKKRRLRITRRASNRSGSRRGLRQRRMSAAKHEHAHGRDSGIRACAQTRPRSRCRPLQPGCDVQRTRTVRRRPVGICQVRRVRAGLIVNRFEFANLRRILCDWDGLDTEDQRCLEPFRARTTSVAPFNLISMLSSRSDQLEAGRRYAKMYTLFLDALPCNAHTTASDALWAGLLVLTCIVETVLFGVSPPSCWSRPWICRS